MKLSNSLRYLPSHSLKHLFINKCLKECEGIIQRHIVFQHIVGQRQEFKQLHFVEDRGTECSPKKNSTCCFVFILCILLQFLNFKRLQLWKALFTYNLHHVFLIKKKYVWLSQLFSQTGNSTHSAIRDFQLSTPSKFKKRVKQAAILKGGKLEDVYITTSICFS